MRRRTLLERERDAAEWVAARRSGLTVAAIAAEAGVGNATVSRATASFGPFPASSVPDETVLAWVERRRRGSTLRSIAAESGVWTKRVGAATRGFGPIPRRPSVDPKVVQEWAEERRRRVPPGEIARLDGVSTDRVYEATKPLGPFPSPLQGPPATVSLRGIGRLSGLSHPSLGSATPRRPSGARRLRPPQLALLAGHRHRSLARRRDRPRVPRLRNASGAPRQPHAAAPPTDAMT